MKKSKPLVFFGSGPVGAATLRGLTDSGFELEAIITKAKPAHHHGPMPVLDFAKKHNIAVFTPADKQELSSLFAEKHFKSPLGLVVDYGLIISKGVIDSFDKGIINSHFSLLPQWRGADPITFAILSGQKTTGVSVMLIDEKMDTGDLLAQEKFNIPDDYTATQLTNDLIKLSNKLLVKTLPNYLAGSLKPYPQDLSTKPTYSRRLTKEDGVIDWGKPAEVLEREIRAYQPWPRSHSNIFGHSVIIIGARVAANQQDGTLVLKCHPGWLEITKLIAPSGRTMSGADFIRGYKN